MQQNIASTTFNSPIVSFVVPWYLDSWQNFEDGWVHTCDLDLGTAHFRRPACTVADPCVLVVAQAGLRTLRFGKLGIEGLLCSSTIDSHQLPLSSLEQNTRLEPTPHGCTCAGVLSALVSVVF
jgi:hypothetical protein